MSAVLVADGLEVDFGGVRAIDDVALEAHAGSITAVIGPNGAGKTTLFNVLSGVIEPDAGSLRFMACEVAGKGVTEIAAMGMARTFQNLEMFEGASVLDTVLVGRHRHSSSGLLATALRTPAARREESENRDVVLDLLKRFDLVDVADRRAEDLPYGVQRRVELARAVASDPNMLLLDEPMAGLTSSECTSTAARIREIAATGVAVLVVEHHIEAVLEISDHVIALDQGQVISRGAPNAVRNDVAVVDAYLGGIDV